MKKLLLPALLIFASVITFAQSNCGIGFAVSGDTAYIGFSTDFHRDIYIDSNKAGIYPWGDTLQGGSNDPNPHFYAPYWVGQYQGTGQKCLNYYISQAEGAFVPVGISFGNKKVDSVGGQPVDTVFNTIDLSGPNKTVTVTVVNQSLAKDSSIYFRISLQDVNDSTLDTYSSVVPGSEYKYVIQDTIKYLDTVVFTADFTNAYKTEYKYAFDYYNIQTSCPNNSATTNQVFDWHHIKGVNFTVLNANQDPNSGTCYYQDSTVLLPISILNVQVGECPARVAGVTKPKISLENLTIMPNPANSVATINYDNVSSSNIVVKVSNLTGRVVKTVEGGAASTSFSVADLPQGMYIVTIEVDGMPASAERLMVR